VADGTSEVTAAEDEGAAVDEAAVLVVALQRLLERAKAAVMSSEVHLDIKH
jgi:hypothetical protein